MPVAPEAVLQDQEGRPMLRFERVLGHPPERVWRALTEPDELVGWHPTPARLESTPGGRVSYLPLEEVRAMSERRDPPEMPEGEVIEYDPPRVLAHTWGEDMLRWELRPHQEGCLLVLIHTFDDRLKAARDAAGWHLCLEALSLVLDGTPRPEEAHGERIPEGWRELNSAYEERFGIPPEKATPPPKG
jgi:uncharacterized protein YndB with AHSA1/START domain